MALIYVTRQIPAVGLTALREAGHELVVSEKDGVLTHEELLSALGARPYEAIVSLLTDQIDESVFAAAPHVRIVANYAVGYNNISLGVTKSREIVVTNTPGVLTSSVAEFTLAMMFAIVKRIPESDRFTRAGRFEGWAPELLLGSDLRGKTLGIVGAGRIGYEVALAAHHGLGMNIVYTDQKASEILEANVPATFYASLDELLPVADVVSIHVPLLPATQHLINAERLARMKPSAYLINTARGPIIDEAALITALQNGVIRGAALDVFEAEPTIAPELLALDNVVLTPHIASATTGTRDNMARIVAQNINEFFAGTIPTNLVTE
jgi:glyoxylate reductase